MAMSTQPAQSEGQSPGDKYVQGKAEPTVNIKHRRKLRQSIEAFRTSPVAQWRWKVLASLTAVVILLAILFLASSAFRTFAAFVFWAVLTGLCYITIGAVAARSYLVDKMRESVASARTRHWLIAVGAIVLAIVVLVTFDLLGGFLVMLVTAVSVAITLYLLLDRPVTTEREPSLETAESVLRDMRHHGVDDSTLRQTVCDEGGQDWETFYEAIFGYEAMLEARHLWGRDDLGRTKRKRLVLRDAIIRWVDHRLESLHRARGQSPTDSLVESPLNSDLLLKTDLVPEVDKDVQEDPPPSNSEDVSASVPELKSRHTVSATIFHWGRLFHVIFGRTVRFFVGGLMLSGCVVWATQNNLPLPLSDAEATPLIVPSVPAILTRWIDSYNVGVAGLILFMSVFTARGRVAGFAIIAAVTVLFGHRWGIPEVAGVSAPMVSIVAGLAIVLLGWLTGQFLIGFGQNRRPEAVSEQQLRLLNARGQVVHGASGTRSASGQRALRLFRTLLTTAFRNRATDLHFEPETDGGVVRMRVDGSMVDLMPIESELFPRLLSLVKVLCDVDITQRRIVQEGHFSADLGRRQVDYRVNYTPAAEGQKMVIRILDPAVVPQRIHQLHMPDRMLNQVQSVIGRESGMILVCGPTGSGKTTTLYAILRDIDTKKRNVITIEDPIEYRIENITQVPVNKAAGNSFSALLQSVLRQDPDVILLGEIRDSVTARTAMQAAMTGHLVLSTVHAIDTVSALVRLLDLEVEPTLLSSSLNLILAQRLVRILCPVCKSSRAPDAHELTMMGDRATRDRIFSPKGCPQCLNTGYRGRRALLELLTIDDTVREVLHRSPSLATIRQAATEREFQTLREMGWQTVADGMTDVEELVRVTGA